LLIVLCFDLVISGLATGGYLLYKYIQIKNITVNIDNNQTTTNTNNTVQTTESDIPNIISDDEVYKR